MPTVTPNIATLVSGSAVNNIDNMIDGDNSTSGNIPAAIAPDVRVIDFAYTNRVALTEVNFKYEATGNWSVKITSVVDGTPTVIVSSSTIPQTNGAGIQDITIDLPIETQFDTLRIEFTALASSNIIFIYELNGTGFVATAGDRFLYTSDIHHLLADEYGFVMFWPTRDQMGEHRVCRTALNRLQAALNNAVSTEVSLLVFNGDNTDTFNPNVIDDSKTYLNMIEEVIAACNAHAFVTGGGRIIMTRGNHEWAKFKGTGAPFTIDEWNTAIEDGDAHVARSNILTDGSDSYGFTYDLGNLRFIALDFVGGSIVSTASTIAWVQARIQESPRASVIIMHISATTGTMCFHTQAFQDMLIANPKAQVCLFGHDHRGIAGAFLQDVDWPGDNPNGTPTSAFDPEITYAQNIYCLTGQGGVRPIDTTPRLDPYDESVAIAANSDPDNGVARDAVHYMIDMRPFAVGGNAQRDGPNVQTTGYFQGLGFSRDFKNNFVVSA